MKMRPSRLLVAAAALASPSAVAAGPCDIFASGGTPCVAAYSTVRSLFSNYTGPLYQLRRQADNATMDVHPLTPGGFSNVTLHNAFCSGGPSSAAAAAGMPSMPPIGYTVNIIPVSDTTLSFRHCYSQAFVTPTDGNPDHEFKLVPALDGDGSAVSFQSLNYPTSYIAPVTTAEPGRLGIVETPSVPSDASWTVTDAGNGAVTLTLKSRGLSMAVGSNLTGICAHSYTPPSASVYLEGQAGLFILNSTGYPPPAACQIWRVYDQSGRGNHLNVAGPAINNPNDDNPVNATRHPLTVGGHSVFGMQFQTGMGYRAVNTSGVATGNDPETLYMVTSGTYVNDGCCFDMGNAESDPTNSSTFADGTMESINFSVSKVGGYWCGGEGNTGPWVMADLENGLWACGTPGTQNPNSTALPFPYVTAMLKGGTDGFALKGGDATQGGLATQYDGPRPPGYQPMRKQGAIILGMGGDNVERRRRRMEGRLGGGPAAEEEGKPPARVGIPTTAIGVFYEGAVTQGYSTDAVDDALQADIVAAGYGQ